MQLPEPVRFHSVRRTPWWHPGLALALLGVACSVDLAPAESTSDGGTDDAQQCVETMAYVDADHDGLGREGAVSVEVCVGELPSGYAVFSGDCDDERADTYRWVYPDRDSDRFGDRDGRICEGKNIPENFVTLPGDCDDTSASVHPLAPEQWTDGLDSDCDGLDDPEACGAAPDACGCDALNSTPKIIVDSQCQLADLFIQEAIRCQRCGRPELIYVVVGNRGMADSPEGAELRVKSSSGQPTVPVLLPFIPSAAASQPLMVDSRMGDIEVRIHASTGIECSESNNAVALTIAQVDCR